MLPHLRVLKQVWNAPGNRPDRLRAVFRALRWFKLQRQPQHPPVELPVFSGQRLYPCYPDSIIAKHTMYRSEWFDWDMMHFLQSYLQPSDHFLDIGANTGLHTLLASTRIDPTAGGTLTCIEPDPQNLTRLRHTLDLNHLSPTLHPVAASDQRGTVTLEGTDVFTRIAVAGVADPGPNPPTDAPSNNPQSAIRNPQSRTTVPALPLDDLLPAGQTYAVCKIDVEGAESQVLHGAAKTLAAGHLPCLIFEHRGHGSDEAALLDWLRHRSYHLGRYSHDTQTLTLSPPFDDDVYAFTDTGLDLVRQRLPGVTLAA